MFIGIIKYKCACIVSILESRKSLIKMLVTNCHVDIARYYNNDKNLKTN